MLRERETESISGVELRRFDSDFFDLLVSLDRRGRLDGFRLTYESGSQRELTLTWHREGGYSLDGLVAGEELPIPVLWSRFSAESEAIDPVIRTVVLERLGATPPDIKTTVQLRRLVSLSARPGMVETRLRRATDPTATRICPNCGREHALSCHDCPYCHFAPWHRLRVWIIAAALGWAIAVATTLATLLH
jgi:hypothetical protein